MSTIKKPSKTGPSTATTAILVLLVAAVACYTLYQIVGRQHSRYETVAAYTCEVDDETTVSGFVVRQESLLPNQDSGVLDVTRDEGERVGVGQSVATVYSEADAMEVESQLDTLRARLDQINYALEVSGGSTTEVKLDSSIQAGILSMEEDLRARQYTTLERDISSLKALVIKRDYSADGTSSADLTAQAADLQAQIKSLEAKQQRSARKITSPSSGLFSAVTDGYENVLTPELLKTASPSQISSASPDSAAVSNVGKMIYGDTWYYAAVMDGDTAAAYKVDHTVRLRFVKELDRELIMTIDRISDSENGKKLIVFSCDTYLSEVALLRRQAANLIRASYTGIRIPTEALRLEEGNAGVYCLVGAQAVYKPVDIVYQGSGYYLVEPSKREDNTENNTSSRLRAGDSVLITAEDLYDGKVIGA